MRLEVVVQYNEISIKIMEHIKWADFKFPAINLWNVWPSKYMSIPIEEQETHNFKYFRHTDCEFWPCHGDIDQNCLFCYCPLAFLKCPGVYTVIEIPKGVFRKDCSECTLTHDKEKGWETVQEVLEYPTLWRYNEN